MININYNSVLYKYSIFQYYCELNIPKVSQIRRLNWLQFWDIDSCLRYPILLRLVHHFRLLWLRLWKKGLHFQLTFLSHELDEFRALAYAASDAYDECHLYDFYECANMVIEVRKPRVQVLVLNGDDLLLYRSWLASTLWTLVLRLSLGVKSELLEGEELRVHLHHHRCIRLHKKE